MSVNSVNNSLRITGMASGLDTEEMVKKLMSVENMKVDKVKQQKQLIEWKQEIYREIINEVNSFKNKYFDVLSDDYILSSKNFSTLGIRNISGTSTEFSVSSIAKEGNYDINVAKLASKATVTSTNKYNVQMVSKPNFEIKIDSNNNTFNLGGSDITIDEGRYSSLDDLVNNINSKLDDTKKAVVKDEKIYFVNNIELVQDNETPDKSNNEINLTYNDKNYKVTIPAGNYTPFDLANKVSDAVHGIKSKDGTVTFPSDVNIVSKDGKTFEFSGASSGNCTLNNKDGQILPGTVVVDYNVAESSNYSNPSIDPIEQNVLQYDKKIIPGFNDRFTVTIGNIDHVVTIDTSVEVNETNLVDKINDALKNHSTNGSISTETLSVIKDEDTGKLIFKSTTGEQIRISGDAVKALGISDDFELNQTSDTKMSEIVSGEVKFKVNDIEFNYDFNGVDKDKTITYIMDDISKKADVDISYNELTRSFNISSKNTGKNAKITLTDEEISTGNKGGEFVKNIFGNNSITANGEDAEVTITQPDGNSKTLYKEKNTFEIDGINYNLKNTGITTFDVKGNSENVVKKIKSFVEEYNNIIEKIETKLTEKKNYDYKPLTDAQKKDMNEDDIKRWEDKAKQGIMRSDNILENMLSSMRSAFYNQNDYETFGISIGETGLSTSRDITQRGKIIIDESKLKTALEENSQKVIDLFSKVSTSHPRYSPDMTNEDRATRTNEEGIFQRISDILQDNLRTTRNSNGKKGLLLEKAGIKGDFTYINNILSDRIKEKNEAIRKLGEKLIDKENQYYIQFSKLEKAMNDMNAQSQWLYSQLGMSQ